VNLGALLQRLGRPAAARVQLLKALSLDERNGAAHFNLGLLCRVEGDLRGAQRAFAAALGCDPPHPRARRELAVACAEHGELDRAISLFEAELREGCPPDASIYANLGLAYARRGDRTTAEGALRHALRLRPRHRGALQNLAAVYSAQGRWLEAAALLRRLHDSGNSDPLPASNK
jgi:Flp pilus assembly protein TadD